MLNIHGDTGLLGDFVALEGFFGDSISGMVTGSLAVVCFKSS